MPEPETFDRTAEAVLLVAFPHLADWDDPSRICPHIRDDWHGAPDRLREQGERQVADGVAGLLALRRLAVREAVERPPAKVIYDLAYKIGNCEGSAADMRAILLAALAPEGGASACVLCGERTTGTTCEGCQTRDHEERLDPPHQPSDAGEVDT